MQFENRGKWVKQIQESMQNRNYVNEGLPQELNDAMRNLSAEDKRQLGKDLYNRTFVDLNNIKANQIKSARGKGEGYWTILFDNANNSWFMYNPDGAMTTKSRGANDRQSFTNVLKNGGIAFNIDTTGAALTVDKRQQRSNAKAGSDIDWNSPLFRDKYFAGRRGWDNQPYDKSGYVSRIGELLKKVSLKTLQKDVDYFINLVEKFEGEMSDTYRKLRAFAAKSDDRHMLDSVNTWATPRQLGRYLDRFVDLKKSIEEDNLKKAFKAYQEKHGQDSDAYDNYDDYKANVLKHTANRFAEINQNMQREFEDYKNQIERCLDSYPELLKILK